MQVAIFEGPQVACSSWKTRVQATLLNISVADEVLVVASIILALDSTGTEGISHIEIFVFTTNNRLTSQSHTVASSKPSKSSL